MRAQFSKSQVRQRIIYPPRARAVVLLLRMSACAGLRAGEWPLDLNLRDCLREEFADVPATVADYETNQPSRCAQHGTTA